MKYKLKKMTAAALVLALGVSAPPLNVQARSFGDVNSDHWAYQHISSLANDGIINGRDDGNFDLYATITRAEFFTIVNNSFGFTEEADVHFPDVNADAWYASQVKRAVAAGYIQGFEDGTLRPGNNVTRAEVAIILNNLLNLPGVNYSGFADVDEIPDWAEDSIRAITAAGVLSTFADGTFRPTTDITRVDSAVALSIVRNNFLSTNNNNVYAVTPQAPSAPSNAVSDDALVINRSFGDSEVQTISGDVKINGTSGLEVRNLVIEGDLLISESQAHTLVSLSNVTVNGAVYINNTNVRLLGSFNDVYVNQPNTRLRLRNSGGTTVSSLTVSESAVGTRLSLDPNTSVANATINAAGTSILGSGSIANAAINAANVTVANASIISNATGAQPPSVGAGTGGGAGGGGNVGGGGGGGGWTPTPPQPPGPGQPDPGQPEADRDVTISDAYRFGLVLNNDRVLAGETHMTTLLESLNSIVIPDPTPYGITTAIEWAFTEGATAATNTHAVKIMTEANAVIATLSVITNATGVATATLAPAAHNLTNSNNYVLVIPATAHNDCCVNEIIVPIGVRSLPSTNGAVIGDGVVVNLQETVKDTTFNITNAAAVATELNRGLEIVVAGDIANIPVSWNTTVTSPQDIAIFATTATPTQVGTVQVSFAADGSVQVGGFTLTSAGLTDLRNDSNDFVAEIPANIINNFGVGISVPIDVDVTDFLPDVEVFTATPTRNLNLQSTGAAIRGILPSAASLFDSLGVEDEESQAVNQLDNLAGYLDGETIQVHRRDGGPLGHVANLTVASGGATVELSMEGANSSLTDEGTYVAVVQRSNIEVSDVPLAHFGETGIIEITLDIDIFETLTPAPIGLTAGDVGGSGELEGTALLALRDALNSSSLDWDDLDVDPTDDYQEIELFATEAAAYAGSGGEVATLTLTYDGIGSLEGEFSAGTLTGDLFGILEFNGGADKLLIRFTADTSIIVTLVPIDFSVLDGLLVAPVEGLEDKDLADYENLEDELDEVEVTEITEDEETEVEASEGEEVKEELVATEEIEIEMLGKEIEEDTTDENEEAFITL